MNNDEDEEEDGYFHNEDGSRGMCTHCCEWLLDDGNCPDPDCERNCDDEDDQDFDPDIDIDGYCNCGSLHAISEIDSGICDCCGGMIPDEEYS